MKEVLAYLSPFFLIATGVLAWLYQHERERRAEIEKQLSDAKYKTYIELLNIFFGLFKAVMTGAKPTASQATASPEVIGRMFDASKDLMIYGSDDVLISYEKWMTKSGSASGSDTAGALQGLGDVLIAIRKDMGHPKTTVTTDHILRLLLKDYEQAKADGLI